MFRRKGAFVETLHCQTPHPGRYFIIYARSPIVKQWCPMNIVSGSEAGDSPYTHKFQSEMASHGGVAFSPTLCTVLWTSFWLVPGAAPGGESRFREVPSPK